MIKLARQFTTTTSARTEAYELGFLNMSAYSCILEEVDSRLTASGYILTVAPLGLTVRSCPSVSRFRLTN